MECLNSLVFEPLHYLIVAASVVFSCIPPLARWLSSNMHNTAAAGLAIALNVPFGAPDQIVDCWIYKANEREDGYRSGIGRTWPCCFGCDRLC